MMDKRQLYNLFKELHSLALKTDLKKFNEINITCTKIMDEIFGNKSKKGDEAFEWDLAKNAIIGIIQNEINKDNISKETYEKNQKIYIAESNKKLKELKRYI